MEWISVAVTVLVGILGGSASGAIVNAVLQKKAITKTSNFERKSNRYYHITTIMELFLYTEESKYSINMSMWDVQSVSVEENKKRALNDLLVNKRYLLFITNNKQVHISYGKFLEKPDKNEYENVLLAMRNDLWNIK